jgi:hypothetical protein
LLRVFRFVATKVAIIFQTFVFSGKNEGGEQIRTLLAQNRKGFHHLINEDFGFGVRYINLFGYLCNVKIHHFQVKNQFKTNHDKPNQYASIAPTSLPNGGHPAQRLGFARPRYRLLHPLQGGRSRRSDYY